MTEEQKRQLGELLSQAADDQKVMTAGAVVINSPRVIVLSIQALTIDSAGIQEVSRLLEAVR